jgi:hypothetical protein
MKNRCFWVLSLVELGWPEGFLGPLRGLGTKCFLCAGFQEKRQHTSRNAKNILGLFLGKRLF